MNCMKRISLLFTCILIVTSISILMAQQDSLTANRKDSLAAKIDSANMQIFQDYQKRLMEIDSVRRTDSIHRAELEKQLASLKTTDNLKKEEILRQLEALHTRDEERMAKKKAQVDSLRSTAVGFPVIGVLNDTIFSLYTRIGSYTARERANNISERVRILYNDDFMNPDSLYLAPADAFMDIMYQERILMSVTENDALWNNTTVEDLSETYKTAIA